MKKFKEYLGEAFFKVKIPDVAPTFVVDAGAICRICVGTCAMFSRVGSQSKLSESFQTDF